MQRGLLIRVEFVGIGVGIAVFKQLLDKVLVPSLGR